MSRIRLGAAIERRFAAAVRAHPGVEVAGVVRGRRVGPVLEGIRLDLGDPAGWHRHAFCLEPTSPLGDDDSVLHLHPDGSTFPSARDLAALEATGVPWIVAAERDGRLRFRAFALRDGALVELGVTTPVSPPTRRPPSAAAR